MRPTLTCITVPHATRAMARLSVAMTAALLITSVSQAAGFQRGPAPTVQALEATSGPFQITSSKVQTPDGYGAGTVFYPTSKVEGSYGLVVLAPGFLAIQNYYAWLAERLASHGFVVVTMNVNSVFEQPDVRAPQMAKALQQVVALSKIAATPYYGMVDVNRLAVMGHSMGGGATLATARDNPQLKAAVALTPWHTTKSFSTLRVPTLVLACQDDTIAPNDTHSLAFYNSFSNTLPSAYMEVAGASHLCAIEMSPAKDRVFVGKYSIAWLKRFLDADTRYTPFINANSTGLSNYKSRGTW